MGDILGYNKYTTSKQEEKEKAVFIGFWATVLAWSRPFDQALTLLENIRDPQLRLFYLGYLTSCTPLPQTTIQSTQFQLGRTPFAIGLATPIIEMACSNQMDQAIELLHRTENVKVRKVIIEFAGGNYL